MDFTLPWAVIPIPGFLVGFWAADRYGDRFRGRAGWRGKLAIFLDSIRIIRVLFAHPLRWGSALCGMALFWAADTMATWAGLAMFGVQMNAAALFVGFATGMVFTRRTGPLAGAGVLALILALTIWVSGAPLAAAVAGVFVYRVLALADADARLARRLAHAADDGRAPGVATERGRQRQRACPAAHGRYPEDEELQLSARYRAVISRHRPASSHARASCYALLN
jgi:hypothetical protein